MPTIKEIAELAGVSRGTVDRVLNNRGSVNPQTADRVREIAEKLKVVGSTIHRRRTSSLKELKLRLGVKEDGQGTEKEH